MPAGTSLMVILELDVRVSILVSATFAAAYTVVGGMYSVSYTDVLQLVCITLGLVSTTLDFVYSTLEPVNSRPLCLQQSDIRPIMQIIC